MQLGGQTALKLAEKLERYGIKIIGTSFQALDIAEDRGRCSELLKENNIPYPKFAVAETAEEALEISKDLNFPIFSLSLMILDIASNPTFLIAPSP